ncbi:MAG: hypothetical protein JO102_01295 [Elusimicrobia bacterium]|nr:hypothetical protein [Elusimicrobiota bacterium]
MKPGRATGPRGLDSNIDPVCGRELRERDPQRSCVVEGEVVFFCSRECHQRFEKDVEAYVGRLRAGVLVSWLIPAYARATCQYERIRAALDKKNLT